jgi:Fe2+ transport system protein B
MDMKQVNIAHDHGACATCPAASLVQMGVTTGDWDYLVALAGNPNTGKSTVFNALTGLRQHTGNWPGKTVARAEGNFGFGNKTYKLVDLPGTYSLLSTSEDEEIARNFILFGRPDVTVVVVDASRLERNLNLALQVLEITDRVVICLNLMDEAERHGVHVNYRRLSRELGVPVVPTVARQSDGLSHLVEAISSVASGEAATRRRTPDPVDPTIEQSLNELTAKVERTYPGLPNARWIALRLMLGDEKVKQAIERNELAMFMPGQLPVMAPTAAPATAPAGAD